MVKHKVDSFSVVQSVTVVFPLQGGPVGGAGATQVGQVDLYNAGAQVGCIHFHVDGTQLPRPEAIGNVVHLHCNTCQFGPAMDTLNTVVRASVSGATELNEDMYVYYNSLTDAGMHYGKDPFEQTGPISF